MTINIRIMHISFIRKQDRTHFPFCILSKEKHCPQHKTPTFDHRVLRYMASNRVLAKEQV